MEKSALRPAHHGVQAVTPHASHNHYMRLTHLHTHVPYGVDHDTCPTLGNIWHSNLVWCIEERGDLFHSDMLPRRSVPFGINRQPHTQSTADIL